MERVQGIREHFPALLRTHQGTEVAYLDGPGGSQVVDLCIEAMSQYMRAGGGNLHGVFPSSIDTEAVLAKARSGMAAFLGARPQEIAFGPNMTTLTLAISRALSRTWKRGDEIVVSELDHRANVDPWIQAAHDRGVTVRWLHVDADRLTLDLSDLDDVINDRTRLVAVGHASNAVGTITDVAAIARRAHACGALVAVDAVHSAPHLPVRMDALGADILLCSAYKFFGPHVGIAAIREVVFEGLAPYKLQPAPDFIPDKLETGTQNHEAIAGLVGTLDYLASLGVGDTQGAQLMSAMASIQAHEERLARQMRERLAELPGVTVYASQESVAKTPTVAFRVDGVHPREVCTTVLHRASVFLADGDFYAATLAAKLGIRESGGWVRAGLAVYNTEDEVTRCLDAIRALVRDR